MWSPIAKAYVCVFARFLVNPLCIATLADKPTTSQSSDEKGQKKAIISQRRLTKCFLSNLARAGC